MSQGKLCAYEIRETRESKIKRLEKFIEEKTNYYNTHYKAKKETLESNINKKISNLKLSKFISVDISYKNGDIIVKSKDKADETKTKSLATITISIDEEERKEVEKLDGCYVIKTSLIDDKKETKEDIHKAYKTLIKVENAFKTLKTEFLEIRPLYLKSDKRIIGHVALSMLSYNIILKLKGYIDLANLDFKSTIRELEIVKTTRNIINMAIKFDTIAGVNDRLLNLFKIMKFKIPTKLD